MPEGNKRDGQTIHHDRDGNEYTLDADGNRITPRQAVPVQDSSGFQHYDESQGHCGLCGRINCNGRCFR